MKEAKTPNVNKTLLSEPNSVREKLIKVYGPIPQNCYTFARSRVGGGEPANERIYFHQPGDRQPPPQPPTPPLSSLSVRDLRRPLRKGVGPDLQILQQRSEKNATQQRSAWETEAHLPDGTWP